MPKYRHLTYQERETFARLRAEGMSQNAIAAELGRCSSSLGRELKRNVNKDGGYNPATADRRYLARRQKLCLLDQNKDLAGYVVQQLNEGWTPETIAGWLTKGHEKSLSGISHESIYAWLYSPAKRADKLWKLLPRRRARRGFRPARKAKNIIRDRTSIHERPGDVDDRSQGGHWEGDLMICNRTRPLLVLTERKSRFTIVAKLKSKDAKGTAQAIMDIFKRLDPSLRRSVTFDNGTEFARHGLLRQALHMATWFCDAYASWQKGAVENMNGRLRRDLPRRLNIDKMSDEDLADINLMHNLMPRKCLAWDTPYQALLSQLGIDAKISFHRGVALQI